MTSSPASENVKQSRLMVRATRPPRRRRSQRRKQAEIRQANYAVHLDEELLRIWREMATGPELRQFLEKHARP